MNRFRPTAFIGAVVCALLLVLYSCLWFVEASRLRAAIDRMIAARTAEGMNFSAGSETVGGFPFRIEAQFATVAIVGLRHLPNAHLTMPHLLVRARPWQPTAWSVIAPEGFVLDEAAASGGFRVTTKTARAGIAPAAGGTASVVEATGIDFRDGAATVDAETLLMHLTLPDKPPEEHTGAAASFDLRIDRTSASQLHGPLGGTVELIACDGVVQGAVPPGPLRQSLATWRDGGGTVELHNLSVAWGDLELAASGTLSLDQNMQPLAAFSSVLRGWPAVLDALVAQGALKPNEANFAKLGLSLLAHPGADGESELKAPITLQNGQFYLEKARIGKLPQITWPD